MIHYNYASDFKIVETLKDEAPFRFTYSAKSGKEVVAEYNGTEYVNCIARDGELVVPINAGSVGLGEVKVKREYFLADTDFADGICHLVTEVSTGIEVWRGETDGLDEVRVGVAPAYTKGDKGDPGDSFSGNAADVTYEGVVDAENVKEALDKLGTNSATISQVREIANGLVTKDSHTSDINRLQGNIEAKADKTYVDEVIRQSIINEIHADL